MNVSATDMTKFEETLNNEIQKVEKKVKFEFEQLLTVSQKLAEKVESFENSKINFESSIKTIENTQVFIKEQIIQIEERQKHLQTEFDCALEKYRNYMNVKLSYTESRLELLSVPCENTSAFCPKCSKFFKTSELLENHCAAIHKAER